MYTKTKWWTSPKRWHHHKCLLRQATSSKWWSYGGYDLCFGEDVLGRPEIPRKSRMGESHPKIYGCPTYVESYNITRFSKQPWAHSVLLDLNYFRQCSLDYYVVCIVGASIPQDSSFARELSCTVELVAALQSLKWKWLAAITVTERDLFSGH